MSDLNRIDSGNLDAIKADGTLVPANRVLTGGTLTVLGCTLASGTTYFFPFGAQHSAVPAEVPLTAFGLRWDNAIIMTISIEDTVFPATIQPGDPRGPIVLSDVDTTAGFWLPENPTTAYVPVVGGTFNASNMTVSVPGGSAGGCIFHLGNFGARRGRGKLVVAGTGGVVRAGVWGKAAA